MITESLWRLRNCENPCWPQYVGTDSQHDFSTSRPVGHN